MDGICGVDVKAGRAADLSGEIEEACRSSSTRSRCRTASRWQRRMRASLVSREVIADSIELVARGTSSTVCLPRRRDKRSLRVMASPVSTCGLVLYNG